MSLADLAATIDAAWENRAEIGVSTKGAVREAVEQAIEMLDSGQARVAEKQGADWVVHQWLKKAVLLSFRLADSAVIPGGGKFDGAGEAAWYDKVPSKFAGWGANRFKAAGFRAVPNCVVRRSAHIAPGVILMPCFVNVGARVDSGTMIDTWATVGSCAQIGRNCHISGGAGIGGFFTPVGAGTLLADGKEERVIGGVPHVLEEPIRADVALVYAARADELGNLWYRRTARNFNPLMATAATVTIAEAGEIVPVGELEPESVVTPHLYVDHVVASA